jgi:hypothetical protein
MKTIGCPGISGGKSFVNQQRFIELIGEFHCVLKGKVVVKSLEHLHPIEYKITVRI